MAIKASFIPGAHQLSVFGDSGKNTVTLSRDAAGQILVNGGAVAVVGGTPTVANTTLIDVFGQGGDDTITLDEANGALPAAHLFGGGGDDVITGGSGADLLFGQSGNDTLLGKGGNDQLFGGSGNDTLTGGAGDDQVFGEAGNDRMIWNPGDGSDLFEGGAGTDTAEVNGGNGSEIFTVTANGSRVRFDRISPAPFSVDIGTTEELVVNANGGDDVITAGNGLANLIHLTLNGGAGNDTITGGDGNDTLIGGDGNDLVIGGRGTDTAQLGAGDDTFVWNPGDGSDVVEGQSGLDTLAFNGANLDEKFDISANGSRVRMTRDIGIVTMDVDDTETINLRALGGADTITIGDLSGTDVTGVNIDLGADGGGDDGSADTIVINATEGDDVISISSDNGVVTVHGLGEDVTISNFGTNDHLVINGLGGDDVIEATGLAAGLLLTANGGDGDDILIGGAGNDTLTGGAGDDILNGGPGQDILDPGPGNNVTIQSAVGNPSADGSRAAALLGQFMASTFVASGASDAMPVADPAMIQQPLLAQPHA
jgi:Ca2+-binding RTX toxin-like protein